MQWGYYACVGCGATAYYRDGSMGFIQSMLLSVALAFMLMAIASSLVIEEWNVSEPLAEIAPSLIPLGSDLQRADYWGKMQYFRPLKGRLENYRIKALEGIDEMVSIAIRVFCVWVWWQLYRYCRRTKYHTQVVFTRYQ